MEDIVFVSDTTGILSYTLAEFDSEDNLLAVYTRADTLISQIPNKYNQGVTPEMRESDRQLHWWYRAREQGVDELLPDWIYDD